jgi:hypothetical protein
MDPRPITGRFQASVVEQLRETPAVNRWTLFSNGFGGCFLVLAVLSLPDPIPVAVDLAIAVALFSGYYCLPFAGLALVAKRRVVEQPVQVLVGSSGIRLTRPGGGFEIPWNRIRRVRERRDCFFVMAGYPRAFYLPKRTFNADDLDAFRAMAASKTRVTQG